MNKYIKIFNLAWLIIFINLCDILFFFYVKFEKLLVYLKPK